MGLDWNGEMVDGGLRVWGNLTRTFILPLDIICTRKGEV